MKVRKSLEVLLLGTGELRDDCNSCGLVVQSQVAKHWASNVYTYWIDELLCLSV